MTYQIWRGAVLLNEGRVLHSTPLLAFLSGLVSQDLVEEDDHVHLDLGPHTRLNLKHKQGTWVHLNAQACANMIPPQE